MPRILGLLAAISLGGLLSGCALKGSLSDPGEPSEIEGDDQPSDQSDDTERTDDGGLPIYAVDGNAEDPVENPGPQNPDPQNPSPQSPGPSSSNDEDGVVMLFPSDSRGKSFRLGSADPTSIGADFDMSKDPATHKTERGVSFWTVKGHGLSYSSGGTGRTVRLNIHPGGGKQTYTWRNGALDHGYISSPTDLRDLEATAYLRVHSNLGKHTSMSWKIRGGQHTGDHDARASCIGLEVPYDGDAPQAARELDHPDYDFIKLKPRFSYQVEDGKWVAVKIVSFNRSDGKSVVNRLYLDPDPFDDTGRPRNQFQLYTEWIDEDGKSTGAYKQAVLWGGWQTTMRIDGWDTTDVAILSARAITAPP